MNNRILSIKAKYIGQKDFTGFEPGNEYLLTISYNQFTRQSLVYAEKENIRAKYVSLNAFFLNFDNASLNLTNTMDEQKITPQTYNEVAKIVGFLNKEEFLHFNKNNPTRTQEYYRLCGDRQNLKSSTYEKLLNKKQLN